MIYLNGVGYKELNHILNYIYEGEVQLYQEDLDKFLEVAQKLEINGLIEEKGKIKNVKEQGELFEVLEDTQISDTKDIELSPNFDIKNTDCKVYR